MALVAEGVTRDTKDTVCDSVASALDGEAIFCELGDVGLNRRILTEQTLFMDVSVEDAEAAQAQVESEDFVSSLENLPEDISVTGVFAITEEVTGIPTQATEGPNEEETTESPSLDVEETTEILVDDVETTESPTELLINFGIGKNISFTFCHSQESQYIGKKRLL